MLVHANTTAESTMAIPGTRTVTRGSDQTTAAMQNTVTLLKWTFSVVPVVAGLDKFTNLLTNWELYLNPMLVKMLPVSPHIFMITVGVIEIAAGVIVFFRPKVGAIIVSAWLSCIALSLLAGGIFLDVAVRDLVMAVSAYTLSRLSGIVEEPSAS